MFETNEDYEKYIEESQRKLNEWVENSPLPGIAVGKDVHGNVIHITTGTRMDALAQMADANPDYAHSVEKSKVEEPKDYKPPKKEEPGCKTCAAKGLKRLITGGAKLLKSELGIDAADAETMDKRKNICLGCEKYNFGVCTDCGCFCAAKVKLTSEKCPIGKW